MMRQALQEEIKRCFNEIPHYLWKSVMKNFPKRARVCQQSRGDYLHDVLIQVS